MTDPSQPRPIEKLAAALQECLDDAVERGAKAAVESMNGQFSRIDARFERIDARFEGIDARLGKLESRMDRQDTTLRMIWKQCGGRWDEPLPIDE